MTNDRVARGYRRAAELTARGGHTYYLAARLLPGPSRRAVFALYGFARHVDDIVDGVDLSDPVRAAQASEHLDVVGQALADDFDVPGVAPETRKPHGSTSSRSTGPELGNLLAALGDTVDRFGIDASTFADFLRSMRMDVPGTPEFRNRYAAVDDLREYTRGSAAVIGVQLLPVLGADTGDPRLRRAAMALGEAFQLTNFLRDVGEDLARDRIYLPGDELAAFGVDEDRLRAAAATGAVDAPIRRALAHLIAVNRNLYRIAEPGIAGLPARTRPAIVAAAAAYHDILTEIEDSGYQVLTRRTVVPRRRRLMRAAAAAAGRAPAF